MIIIIPAVVTVVVTFAILTVIGLAMASVFCSIIDRSYRNHIIQPVPYHYRTPITSAFLEKQ